MTRVIKIVIADDHAIVRDGLKALIGTQDDMEVIGEAEDGMRAVRLAKKLEPDVMLLDVVMPVLNGVDAAIHIGQAELRTRILFLSSLSDSNILDRAIGVRGFAGYVIKQCAREELFVALRDASLGRQFFSASIQRLVERSLACSRKKDVRNPRKPTRLTPRELQVLQFIAESLTNVHIAEKLGISKKTVEKHRQQVMDKLGLHDVARLTRYAIERQMVEMSSSLR